MATLTKRQKQMVDYLENYINEHGYAPTLAEVGEFFGLSSLATVHKHLRNLESKGFIKRQHNHSRALEIAQRRRKMTGAQELSLLGQVAAGQPIEAIEGNETISVPEDFVRRDNTFCPVSYTHLDVYKRQTSANSPTERTWKLCFVIGSVSP